MNLLLKIWSIFENKQPEKTAEVKTEEPISDEEDEEREHKKFVKEMKPCVDMPPYVIDRAKRVTELSKRANKNII
jgi:hypothetical protein